MPANYANLPPETAQRIDRLTRLMYDLRENRKAVLAAYAVEDETSLLARIVAGEVPEHPAYEHFLSTRVLEETRAAARQELAGLLAELERS